MKEHVQKTGVRKYAGDDLIELQAEPLAAIQGFFREYGNSIISGCEIIPAGENYNITAGLLALQGTGHDGADTFKIVPFSGVSGVSLPVYFTLTHSVVERVYADGKVKPIAYDYRAACSAIRPEGSCLELTPQGGRRFADAIRITDKLDKTGNARDTTATFTDAATRDNITSGEKLSALFGKIRKWFADLKPIAFTAAAADLATDPAHRLATDAEKAAWDAKCSSTDPRLSDARPANGGNADTIGGLPITNLSVSAQTVNFGGSDGDIGTDEFINILKSSGAFNVHNWSARGAWYFNGNKTISDTGVGRISLAGAAVEVIRGEGDSRYTIRITTPAGSTGNSELNRVFVYTDNDETKAWFRLANSSDIPASLPASDVHPWAKQADKPNYNFTEIQDAPNQQVNDTNIIRKVIAYTQLPYGFPQNIAIGQRRINGGWGKGLISVGKSNEGTEFTDFEFDVNGRMYSPLGEFAVRSDIPTSYYRLDVGGDTDHYYPCTWRIADKTAHFSIHSQSGGGEVPYNQNVLRCNISAHGWADMAKRLTVEESTQYDTNEITIHSIWYGDHSGMNAIYLRGGLSYFIESNITLTPQLSGITSYDEVYNIMSNDGTVENTNVTRLWNHLDGISLILKNEGYQTINGNLALNTPDGSFINFSRTGVNKGYVGCGASATTDVYLLNYSGGGNIKIADNGKNYSNGNEIATVDQIPTRTDQIAETTNKKYVTDVEKEKLSCMLEMICAGVVDKDGNILISKGRTFSVEHLMYGSFIITHNQDNSNMIIMVSSDFGKACYHHVTNNKFSISSFSSDSNNILSPCGFSFIVYTT